MARHENERGTAEREREVIVTDTGRSRSGIGGVIAAVLGAIVVLIVAWLLFFNGGGEDAEFEAPVPDDINVDVNNGEGGGS